jgi:hypothetical protein
MGYLLEQKHATSTWTLCTGMQAELGTRAAPAMTQGALVSMAAVASRDNQDTNVRFNEVYLGFRVEVDDDAARHGVVKASQFASVYEKLLDRPDIRGCRVSVLEQGDMEDLKYKTKIVPVE